jgi:ATP-binding cassette subfamily C protein CydC
VSARRDPDPLWRAVRLLEVRPRRVALSIVTGVASLGSAVALSGVSAWLIARAAQMPLFQTLAVAAVAVRLFGISRGVLRYVERLVSHDVALRGMATLRTRLYERLSAGSPAGLLTLRRGDLLARVGADVDAVGDVVVRGLLPMGVALVLGIGSSVAMALFLPSAGLALALCLVLAGVVAPWWAQRTARGVERDSAQARAELAAVTQSLLDGAGELTVAGRVTPALADLRAADAALARATDRGAGATALSAALLPLATGLAALAALWLGIPATTAGTVAPVELAVLVLTPLAAFEASAVLPGAAVALLRSREAARRVVALLDAAEAGGAAAVEAGVRPAVAVPATAPAAGRADHPAPGAPLLEAHGLACGWPDGPVLLPEVDLTLRPGSSVAVVGPSGLGKTTLLLTLAGLLAPRAGRVTASGVDLATLDRAHAAAHVGLTAEDAHVFDTSVLENLRVARGDVTTQEARATLAAVGLGPWLEGLPDGLDTRLGSDAARVSGGERRRLLVARAVLGGAEVLLLDEPTEHLDAEGQTLLTALLDGSLAPGRAVLVVTHRLAGLEAAGEVILLDGTGSVGARGRHEELLEGAHPGYRAAWLAEQQEDG